MASLLALLGLLPMARLDRRRQRDAAAVRAGGRRRHDHDARRRAVRAAGALHARHARDAQNAGGDRRMRSLGAGARIGTARRLYRPLALLSLPAAAAALVAAALVFSRRGRGLRSAAGRDDVGRRAAPRARGEPARRSRAFADRSRRRGPAHRGRMAEPEPRLRPRAAARRRADAVQRPIPRRREPRRAAAGAGLTRRA